MCVPQYGATAGLTWFSAPGGQEGLVSHPPLGQCVLFASLNLNAGRAASQLPLPSFRAHSTCLPCSALCTPPPPSTPKSLPLGLASEDCSCLYSEPPLGGPRAPEAAAHPVAGSPHFTVSLSGSYQTGWMGLNKGCIL